MRVMVRPGVWEDRGPARGVPLHHRATGYAIASSPSPSIADDEERRAMAAPCPRGHVGHRRKVSQGPGKYKYRCTRCPTWGGSDG